MANVKLILVESIHRLGEAGDLVSVKPGFARNYLLPQGKAMLATESRVKELEHKRRIAEEKAARELKDLQALKRQLEGLRIEIGARAGESGKLFGSVTAAQIAERVEATGLPIDRRRIDMDPIKEVGEHKVSFRLLRELVAELTVNVVAETGPSPEEEDEAVAEAREARERRERRRAEEDEEEDDERERG